MFGIGMQELIIIVIIALLVVGPKKLPDVAKTLGKGFNDFRNAMDGVTEDFKQTIKSEEKTEGKKPVYDELKDSLASKQNEVEESEQQDLFHKNSDKK